MDSINYTGKVTISKITPKGKEEEVFSSHNAGTSNLLKLLLDSLDYNASFINGTKSPRKLALGYKTTHSNDDTFSYNISSFVYFPVQSPERTPVGIDTTSGSISLTYYLSTVGYVASDGNVYLFLIDNDVNNTVLAEVDTGKSTYNIAEDETHIIKWELKITLNQGGN